MKRKWRVLPAVGCVATALALGAGGAAADVSRSQEMRARVFKLLSDGIQAHKEGRQKDAIALLRQASDIALNSFRAYYYLGLALKADRQYQAAIDPLQVALELDPVNLQAHVALGDCYLRKGDPAEALAEYHRALSLQNDYAPAFDGLGRAAEASGDDEKAIEHYRKAIDLNPGFPDAALNLGDLYLRERRFNEAIELFLSAIKVRPDFASAYNRLGVAYAQQRLHNEAIAALRQAQVLERGNPWHPVTIGNIYLELDNFAQAGREFDAALRLDPDYLEAYQSRAALLRRQGRFAEAIRSLDEGLARDVDEPRLTAKMKESRARIEGEAARAAELEARLAADPGDAGALEELGDLKAELGDHAAAASLYLKAAGGGSRGGGLMARLGYSALRAEMYEEAAEAFEALSRVSPSDAAVFVNLGLARLGQGDAAGAEEALREANRLRPGDPRPLAYLGNLYVMRGEKDKAVASLAASLALVGEGDEGRERIQRLLRALESGGPAGNGGKGGS